MNTINTTPQETEDFKFRRGCSDGIKKHLLMLRDKYEIPPKELLEHFSEFIIPKVN